MRKSPEEKLREAYPEPDAALAAAYQRNSDAQHWHAMALVAIREHAAAETDTRWSSTLYLTARYLFLTALLLYEDAQVQEFWTLPSVADQLLAGTLRPTLPDDSVLTELDRIQIKALWSGMRSRIQWGGSQHVFHFLVPSEMPRLKPFIEYENYRYHDEPLPRPGGRPEGSGGSGRFRGAKQAYRIIQKELSRRVQDDERLTKDEVARSLNFDKGSGLDYWLSKIQEDGGPTWGQMKRHALQQAERPEF